MTSKLWFQSSVAIIFTLIIIRLVMEVQVIFTPFFAIASTIFLPLLLGGVLFYLTRPILDFLLKRKFPKWAAILTIFLMIGGALWLFYVLVSPLITEQVNNLFENAPSIIGTIEGYVQFLLNQRELLPDPVREQLNGLPDQFSEWASTLGSVLLTFLMGLISGLISLILVPFFLVYILIDHKKFLPFVSQFFSGTKRSWVRKTLKDIDETLKSYILGQLFVSFIVGILLFIGYMIIGLEYAFLLALIGMLTNVIPFIGPYIAAFPAMIIALAQDPIMAVYVAVIMIVSQQIESDLITPNVMGNALDVHPLTVLTLLLAAGSIAGIWGIILAVPFYAVVKSVVTNIYAYKNRIENTLTKDV